MGFAQRLKALRGGLGYTQKQMAAALGIGPARYSKYEIGRSQAPYDVLVRIARLGGVTLDYLIAGETDRHPAQAAGGGSWLRHLVDALPLAAVIYDQYDKLLACNRAFQRLLFPDRGHVLRPGTPQEFLLRAWAYSQGHDAAVAEEFVRRRLAARPSPGAPFVVQVGDQWLRLAESQRPDFKLVLVTEVQKPGD